MDKWALVPSGGWGKSASVFFRPKIFSRNTEKVKSKKLFSHIRQ